MALGQWPFWPLSSPLSPSLSGPLTMAHKRPKNGKALNSRRVVFSFHKQALVCLQQALTGLIVCFPRDDLGQWETGNTLPMPPMMGRGRKDKEQALPPPLTPNQSGVWVTHRQLQPFIPLPSGIRACGSVLTACACSMQGSDRQLLAMAPSQFSQGNSCEIA